MLLVLLGAARAEAGTYDVTTTDDSAVSGRLRDAMTSSYSGDPSNTITFQSGGTGFHAINTQLPGINRNIVFNTASGDVTVYWSGATGSYLLGIEDENSSVAFADNLTLEAGGDENVTNLLGMRGVRISDDLANSISAETTVGGGAYGILGRGDVENLSASGVPFFGTPLFPSYGDVHDGDIYIDGSLEGTVSAVSAGDGAYGLKAGHYAEYTYTVTYLSGFSGPWWNLQPVYSSYPYTTDIYFAGDINIEDGFTGDVTAVAAGSDAYGFYAQGDPALSAYVLSDDSEGDIMIGGELTGDVTATASGGENAYGFRAFNDISIGSVGRRSDVVATANTDNAYGFRALTGSITIGGDFGGDVLAQAINGENAYGLRAGGLLTDSDITIEGSIGTRSNITALAGTENAYGLRASRTISIGEDLDGDIWAQTGTGDNAYGLRAGTDITISGSVGERSEVTAISGRNIALGMFAGDDISMSSLDGQVTATAQNDWALGLAALGDIAITDQEACLAGDVTATATDGQASAGLVALGMINGGDDGEGGYNPMQVSGTVTATSGDGSAVGIMAWDAMNLRITGDISGTDLDSDASGNDEGYAIRSGRFNLLFDGGDFNGSTSAAEDMIEVADGGSLTGKVFLGDGNDAMRVIGEDADPLNDAIISTVSVLDGGEGAEDLLTFDDWTGTLGNEVVNWETINLDGESVVNLGGSKTAENLYAAPGDDYAAIKTFADGQFVTMTIGEDARLVTQGVVPGSSAGEYELVGNLNNNGVLDLLDDEVNDVFRIVSNDAGGGNYAAASELWIDADLSVSGVLSDEYVEIEGDATGTTTVLLNNVVSHVAVTEGDGIEIVDVGGSSVDDAFVLGNPNDFGPFAVDIARGTTDTESWFAVSPGYREEAAVLQSVTPFIEHLASESVMKFHERRAYGWFRNDSGEQESWWVRTYGSKYRLGLEGDAATKLEGYSGWFQVGSDLIAEGDKDTRFDLGLFAGVGYGEADVDGLRSDKAGELSQTAYGIGAYMTLHQRGNWYLDAVAQAIYNDLKVDYLTEGTQKPDAWSYIASLETGGCIPVGPGFRFEPQAQLIYQHTEGIDLSTLVGEVNIEDHDGLQGRLSLAGVAGACKDDLNPFFEVTVVRDFSEDNQVKYLDGSVTLNSNPEKWFLGGAIGLSRQVSEKNDLGYYLKAGAMYGMDDLDSYNYSLVAGLRKSF